MEHGKHKERLTQDKRLTQDEQPQVEQPSVVERRSREDQLGPQAHSEQVSFGQPNDGQAADEQLVQAARAAGVRHGQGR